eukprot:gene4295-7651_t
MSQKKTTPKDFAVGGLATAGAGFFSNPFEVVKIRLQLQGELETKATHKKPVYTGTFNGFYKMIKNEGLFSIQKGLPPALLYQFFMNGVRLGMYSTLQANFGSDDYFFFKNMASACFSGALGGVVGSPFYLVKTRLQAQSTSSGIGFQRDYKGTMDAFKKVYKNEHISGFFRGWRAMALRVSTGSAVQLSTYDQSKRFILNNFNVSNGVLTHFLSSLVSGFWVTVAMNPFDVVSTRIYNEGTSANGKGLLYNGVFDCIVKMMKTED